jgi:hypothetical protein
MKIPLLSKIRLFWLHTVTRVLRLPLNYQDYWDERYDAGFSSGAGSYGDLAAFKADIINGFIRAQGIHTIMEFGCGDGNQLKLMHYEKYLGLDIAYSAVQKCRMMYARDHSKSFICYHPQGFVNNRFIRADLVVCLDVLYHILPEDDYLKTLDDIFSSADRFVILYTDTDQFTKMSLKKDAHIIHRDTLSYLKKYPAFSIIEIIPNKYPDLSWANFIILKKTE